MLEALGKLSETCDSLEQAGIALKSHRLMGQAARRTGSAQLWTLHRYAFARKLRGRRHSSIRAVA